MTPEQTLFGTRLAKALAPAVEGLVNEYTDMVIADRSGRKEVEDFLVFRGREILATFLRLGISREVAKDMAVMVIETAINVIKTMPKDVSARLIARRLKETT